MHANRATVLAGVCLLLAVATAAHAGGKADGTVDADRATVTVNIKDLQFDPAEITITAGTVVRWVNLDPVDHDVTSGVSVVGRKTRGMKQTRFPDGNFASGLFGQNKSFSVTFDKRGEYNYYCNIHPFMVARIVVQ